MRVFEMQKELQALAAQYERIQVEKQQRDADTQAVQADPFAGCDLEEVVHSIYPRFRNAAQTEVVEPLRRQVEVTLKHLVEESCSQLHTTIAPQMATTNQLVVAIHTWLDHYARS